MTPIEGFQPADAPRWTLVVYGEDILDKTERLAVPGGWLYRTVLREPDGKVVSLAFVPKRWWMR